MRAELVLKVSEQLGYQNAPHLSEFPIKIANPCTDVAVPVPSSVRQYRKRIAKHAK